MLGLRSYPCIARFSVSGHVPVEMGINTGVRVTLMLERTPGIEYTSSRSFQGH